MDKNFYCIIMAGGIGTRFWPISRNSRPKQFLDILGCGRSFLQMTYDRFVKIVPKENIIVVTSGQYTSLVKEQLPDLLDENILGEPYRRNTAPCIAYSAYKLYKKNPNATVVVTPSDHLIIGEDLFTSTISSAMKYASQRDELYTLGITPTRPDTNYGYIQANKAYSTEVEGHIVDNVKTFTEKPNEELAKVFIESGEFFWNSGIFIWNLKTIIQQLEEHTPDVAEIFKGGSQFYNTQEEKKFIDGAYNECPSISIDYGVMEKTSKACVFEANFGWSDLGTWTALYTQSPNKDEQGNVVEAPIALTDKKLKNTMVVSHEENKLVVVKGLDNFLVINTDDVLLVCPKDDASVKNVITDLTMSNDKQKYL